MLERTRRPSEGSVPAIAPARAAVRDSTSSVYRNIQQERIVKEKIVHTNQDYKKGILFFYQLGNTVEEPLN